MILNTYLLEREDYTYDEIRSMVINAPSRKAALKIASEACWSDWTYNESEITIECVNQTKGVILTDGLNG